MNDIQLQEERRFLCQQRDKEFLAIYRPTLDILMEQGLSKLKARRAAVEFTIANGHPHYHVNHERAYRLVCHLLRADEKKGPGARTFRTSESIGLPKRRLRQQMWYEITDRVRALLKQGIGVDRAIEHVLNHCCASRFFITPETALTKICTHDRIRALRD